MPFSEEEKQAILAEARENLRIADELLAERRDPLENVIAFTPKPPPEPEPQARRTFTDAHVARLIQTAADDLRNALVAQRAEILEWVDGLLIEVTRDYLDRFEDTSDKVISLTGDVANFKRKAIEPDITSLRADLDSLRTVVDALAKQVEVLGNQVATLSDDVANIERASKVITLQRGAS